MCTIIYGVSVQTAFAHDLIEPHKDLLQELPKAFLVITGNSLNLEILEQN
jgi:hypothetical protein